MRKHLAVVLCLVVVAGVLAGPAQAKKKKKVKRVEHSVEITYSTPNAGVSTPQASGGTCLVGQPVFTCLTAVTTADDVYVSVEVTDASGQKVGGFLAQNDNTGDGVKDGYGNFCGASSEPIPLETPGLALDVSIFNGACIDGTPSVVTSGTITLTFSNLP